MENVSLVTVCSVVEGTLYGSHGAADLDVQPADVSIDSRSVGAGALFFALEGEHADGHCFVADALRKGAAAAVVRMDWETPHAGLSGVLIGVADPLLALAQLAGWYRQRFGLPMVAITGTNGKTTTKDMMACVLSTRHRVLKTGGSFNNHIGVPLTLLGLSSGHEVAVVELGMSAPGEITTLSKLVRPSVGVITNVGPAHFAAFDSVADIAAAKGELLQALDEKSVAVLNVDDPLVMSQRDRFPGRVIGYGIEAPCAFRAEKVQMDGCGNVSFFVRETRFVLSIPGRHNIYNALAAIAVGSLFGISPDKAAQALKVATTSPMRMEVSEREGITFLNDGYNANPISMRSALETLADFGSRRQKHHQTPTGRRIAVLGDMLELGAIALQAHEEVGGLAQALGVDALFCFGDFSKHTQTGAIRAGMRDGSAQHFDSKEQLSETLGPFLRSGDVVLIKGSRGMRMEEILEGLAMGE
ncbi:MAG: UDP-N-acetylmuramoyl-tripeptide--D-alanyl-D-alanine ligase [Candidatus Latescibacterota bacterium]